MEYAENVFPYSEFPQEKELKGEVIELDTALFRCPFRIRVEGDKAIVMDLHGIDYYAHLFQYPSFRYLSSLGRRGDSPTEMLSIENVRFYNHKVWTLDANKRELTRLGFSSSSDSLLRDEAVTLGEDILRPLDFAIRYLYITKPHYSCWYSIPIGYFELRFPIFTNANNTCAIF